MQPSAKLQSAIETLAATLPDFDSVSVTKVDGSKVASYFESQAVNNLDNFTCDRQFTTAVSAEYVAINRPLVRENNFLGCLEAKINLNSIDRLLEEDFILATGHSSLPLELTLIDSSNKAIATNRKDLEINSQYSLQAKTSPLSPTILEWVPPNKNRPATVRWQESLFLQKTPLDRSEYLRWSLVAEMPASSIINYLHGIYIRHLGTILLIGYLAIASAIIASQKLLKPIEYLAVATQKLPEKLLQGVELKKPEKLPLELNRLVGNFQILAASLQENFTELNRANQQLNIEITRRKKEQNSVEELNENLEERVKERTAELEISLAQLRGLI